MNAVKLILAASISLAIVGCASGSRTTEPTQGQAVSSDNTRIVKSRDGSFEGEMVGTPAPNSKFAKLKIGMSREEVQGVMGRAPENFHTYESGKRWIPFYFGNDARRMQVNYKGEGCLIFTGGNAWGGAGGDLIQIEPDPSGACYQP